MTIERVREKRFFYNNRYTTKVMYQKVQIHNREIIRQ